MLEVAVEHLNGAFPIDGDDVRKQIWFAEFFFAVLAIAVFYENVKNSFFIAVHTFTLPLPLLDRQLE